MAYNYSYGLVITTLDLQVPGACGASCAAAVLSTPLHGACVGFFRVFNCLNDLEGSALLSSTV